MVASFRALSSEAIARRRPGGVSLLSLLGVTLLALLALRPAGAGAQEPQLDKTMAATTGSGTVWNLTKDASGVDLQFDTCQDGPGAQAKPATFTLRWTKSAADPQAITIVTNITVTNPANRTVHATVTDRVYAGTDQTTQVGTTFTSPLTVIPANSSVTITNTQAVPAGTATHFNDVATATYTDPVDPESPIPGDTNATAEADVEVVNVPHETATVTDVEQISGTGLSFSVDSTVPAGAASQFQGGYQLGTETTGPLTWSQQVSDSGQVVFNKTVHAAGDLGSTGALTDAATLVSAAGVTRTATRATTITARGCVSVRCGGEPATNVGTSGSDILVGTPGKDVIVGLGGRDTIRGLGAKDRLCGNKGKDKLKGGGGNDTLNGGPGRDKCIGGPGDDTARKCEVERSI